MPPIDGARGGSTRSAPVWLLALAGALLIARIVSGVWAEANPESRPELIDWTAPSAAADEARESGRLVLYAFLDRRDAASRKLSSQLFADAGRATELNRAFVPVRIEGPAGDDLPEIAALRSKYHLTDAPTLVVATADGAKSKVIPGRGSANSVRDQLVAARIELLDLPAPRSGGFQFQFGTGGRGGRVVDSLGAHGDSVRTIE